MQIEVATGDGAVITPCAQIPPLVRLVGHDPFLTAALRGLEHHLVWLVVRPAPPERVLPECGKSRGLRRVYAQALDA
jgi:hypothetical protein